MSIFWPEDLFDYNWESDDSGKLENAFWDFHRRNPVVYETLVSLARQWKAAGHGRCGIKMLWETARWELLKGLGKDHLGIKLCNNHHAFYARLIMDQEPDLVGFFILRQQKIQTSFGPNNGELESGEHRS